MPDLLCYKLNAGADVGQPENCPRAPYGLLASRALAMRVVGYLGISGCFYYAWMFKGSLKTGKRFSGCLWLGGVGLKAGLGQIAIFRLPCGGKLGDVERG